MEYCAGGSVSDVMHTRGAGLDEDMIAYICGQTLAGLAYLHSVGKVRCPGQSAPGWRAPSGCRPCNRPCRGWSLALSPNCSHWPTLRSPSGAS